MLKPVRILIFNVEHGNCQGIWTPGGKLIVIDIGTSDSFSPLQWLKSQGIQIIDLLILTHPHDDHIRGFRDLNGINVRVLHRPRNIPTTLTSELDTDLKKKWDAYDSYFIHPVPDSHRFYDRTSPFFDGLSLQFFGGRSESANLNNYSVVTVLDYCGFKVVFLGDLENAGWTPLLSDSAFKTAIKGTTILMASHHGREAGWCLDLFQHISPKLVIVSDGSCTDTSVVPQYCQQASGANVFARNTKVAQTRYVVSTRDNGHIDINISHQNGSSNFTVSVDRH
jgi:competence protein ComEC